MNQGVECLIHRFTNHLAARHQLSVELVKNIFKVVTFDRFLRVEEFEELLHELGSDVLLEGAHFDGLIDNELEEELVDTLKMGPCGVHFFFLVDTSLGKA